MSNKIQSGPIDRYAAASGASGVTRSRAPGAAPAAGKSAAASPASIASDSLQLTGDAVLLQEASSAALGASGIDTQQVADVRQALRNGTYQINPQMIASKMMKMDWELAAS